MKRSAEAFAYACVAAAVVFILLLAYARAADCPPNVARCKVLILTPDEEQALVQPNGVFDIAERGASVALGPVIRYFRERLEKAPAGEVKAPEAKPQQ